MAKKRKAKKEDKEQSQRFVETARNLEVDESGAVFDRAINALAARIRKKDKDAQS